MRFGHCLLLALCAMLFATGSSLADKAPSPNPDPSLVKDRPLSDLNVGYMSIEYSDKVSHAVLQIPDRFLRQPNIVDKDIVSSISPTNTIVAGVSMCLAVIFFGLWASKKTRTNSVRIAGNVSIVVLTILTSAAAFANLAPPPRVILEDVGTLPAALAHEEQLHGGVEVVFVPDGQVRHITLYLPTPKPAPKQ